MIPFVYLFLRGFTFTYVMGSGIFWSLPHAGISFSFVLPDASCSWLDSLWAFDTVLVGRSGWEPDYTTSVHPVVQSKQLGVRLDPFFAFPFSFISISKSIHFLHIDGRHPSPRCRHLLPGWLISLAKLPASILDPTAIHFHAAARVTEHMLFCLKSSNDFLLLLWKKRKSHCSCLPLRPHRIPLSMSLTRIQMQWLLSFPQKMPSYFSLRACVLAISFAWNVFTWFLITADSVLQWIPISNMPIKITLLFPS